MDTIRITKEFSFETAHALDGYDGKCKDIHGHTYHLSVTVIGEPIKVEEDVKRGMVMDFGDLKKIVKEHIVETFDHALVVREDSRFAYLKDEDQKTILTNYQPTCENMIIDFAQVISAELPDHVALFSLKLRETNSAYAEWFMEDQI